jgi:fructose-specific phosphotransferase system IIA component
MKTEPDVIKLPERDRRAPGLWALCLIVLLLCTLPLAAQATDRLHDDLTHRMTVLAMQLGLIIFAARLLGMMARKIGLPSLIGELAAGIVIGPHMLGAVRLPFLPLGLFEHQPGPLPISMELYGFATVAAVVMLFVTGLDTDLRLLVRFSLAGTLTGLSGAVLSMAAALGCAALFLGRGPGDPVSLFLGVLSMSASVGITARVLHERHLLDLPEGVTAVTASVVQDVLSIVALAVALSVAAVLQAGGAQAAFRWTRALLILGQTLGIWLGLTALALVFGTRIGIFLKVFRTPVVSSVMALGLAFVMAGIFEKAGVAMIIGAYVMGLALSRTDIRYVIQEKLAPMEEFFVPIFFAVMGTLVNVRLLVRPEVIIFGLVFAAVAAITKVAGSGLPALALGFNRLGSLRIGSGTMPRGEVALIVASVGVATGILSNQIFGVAVVMVLVTTLLGTPLFTAVINVSARGTRRPESIQPAVKTLPLPSENLARLVLNSVLQAFRSEGFYLNRMDFEPVVFQLRKEQVFLSLTVREKELTFISDKEDMVFVNTILYESLLSLNNTVSHLKELIRPERLKREAASGEAVRSHYPVDRYLDPACVELALKGRTKEEIITELVEALAQCGRVRDTQRLIQDVLARERSLSTGMSDGIAIPHARSDAVETICFAMGIKSEGVDFGSLDGQPARIFVLIASPQHSPGPHLQLLAALGGLLKEEPLRAALLGARTPEELIAILRGGVPRGMSMNTRHLPNRPDPEDEK